MNGVKEKLVIIGDGETAELACDYFTYDSNFEVVGFAAEAAYRKNRVLSGLPVVDFEGVEQVFSPNTHRAFVAVSYTNLNRLRRRLFKLTKQKGYKLTSYISSKSYVSPDVALGENCFILENTVVQRGAKIGDDVTLWSGSSVGHRSQVGSHCFLAMHVAVSGFCWVGAGSFLGVNSCTVGAIRVGEDCVVGAGAVLLGEAESGHVYVGNPAKALLNQKSDDYISGVKTI